MKTQTIFALTLISFASASLAQSKNPSLDPLVIEKDFEAGCSCSVTNAKNEFLVVSDLQDKAPATVRLNGQKIKLKWLSSTEKTGKPKVGDIFNRVYADGITQLKINYKTTSVCGADDESCEVTSYSVDTILHHGKKKSELSGLKGDCGC